MIGAAVSAAGTLFSAAAQSASYRAQSQYAARQSQMALQQGNYQAQRQRDATTRQIAGMRGQYLSSGIALSGSAADVISDSATEASLDEQAVRFNSKVTADNYTFESKLAKQNASNAMIGGTIGALSEGVTRLMNPYQKYGFGLS